MNHEPARQPNPLGSTQSPQPPNKLNLPATSPSFSINLPVTQPLPSYPAPAAGLVKSELGLGPGSGPSSARGAAGEELDLDDDRSATGTAELDEENGAKPARKKSKRPRQVLSCTMCVRRKTKCDKIHPCTACVKRGDPAGCHIETGDEPPS